MDRLLTSDEIAAHLGIKPHQLFIWRRNHKGPPYIKIGPRLIRYSLAEFQAWLDAHSHRHDSAA